MKELPSFRSTYQEARDRVQKQILEEKQRVKAGEKPWPIYDDPPFYYEKWFDKILGESFTSFFTNRREEKKKVFALDVMGTCKFSDESVVDGEASITLVDFRSERQKKLDLKQNRITIAGDVLRNTPWLKAKEFIDKNDNTKSPGFDLITCRPIGGWKTLRKDPFIDNFDYDLIEWIVVQRMYSLLNPQGGTMLAQMPGEDYQRWINKLNQEGINAKTEWNVIKIVKTDEGKNKLPKIGGVTRPIKGKYAHRVNL